MTVPEICFWASAACVAYAYVAYPLVILLAARLRPRPVRRGKFGGRVSVVLSAYNEQHRIASRRDELCSLLKASGVEGQVLIVSDGSTDETAAAARRGADPSVTVIELPQNVGKAAALSTAFERATGDVLVFADVRQRWSPDAMRLLLENFADPTVGGVSGDLCLQSPDGATASVGLYWKYEKWLRNLEGQVHSTVGATGAVSAVRRDLFTRIPNGTVLDDVYWPLCVNMGGYRVVHDPRAKAFDRLPDRARDELRRKIRTLSGNFQLLMRLPGAALPLRNPTWFQFISHKLMRLVVPWALLAILVSSALVPSWPYRVAFAAQILFYLMALAGSRQSISARLRVTSAAASFVILNVAAWLAFWVWLSGRASRSWHKASYATAQPA